MLFFVGFKTIYTIHVPAWKQIEIKPKWNFKNFDK